MNSRPTAKSIAEHLLDQTGWGLLNDDFKTFVKCFLLPQTVETFDGKRYLQNKNDVRVIFDGVRAHHEKMGVTDMVRHVVTADYRDMTTISSIHQSRIVQGPTLIQKPYNVFSVLKFVDGNWRIAQSQYAVDDSPSLCHALVGEPPAMTT